MTLNINHFTDKTKKICICSSISIFLIVLFIISPLSNFFFISLFMKCIIIFLLIYTIYLNNTQINYLIEAKQFKQTNEVYSQLNINIICSYLFTLFIGLLIFFIIKTFF
jgi:hypothetical protein